MFTQLSHLQSVTQDFSNKEIFILKKSQKNLGFKIMIDTFAPAFGA
jgi:hypothetical protein